MALTVGTGISVGWEARVSIDDGVTNGIVCVDKILPRHTRELVRNSEGAICGDPDLPNWRTQKGRHLIRGTLLLSPTGAVFDHLVPLLGWNELSSLASYELGLNDTLATWDMKLDFEGSVHLLTDCICERWAIRGSKGSAPIQMQIDYIAETETEGSWGSPTALDIEDIYAYTDLTTFTIDGTSRLSADRFLIQVDNKPVIEYGASTTMTDAHIGPRECVIATSTPYIAAHDDMYWTVRDDETGMATVITLTSADRILTFTAAKAIGIPQLGPVLSRADQIRTPVTLLAHRSDTGPGTRVSPLTLAISNPA